MSQNDLERFDYVFEETPKFTHRTKIDTPIANKRKEFIDALNYLTENETYNLNEIKNWKISRTLEQGFFTAEGAHCICGKSINYLYYIYKDDLVVQVGSKCVKNVDEKLYLKLTKQACNICSEPILDQRRKCAQYNCCSDKCATIQQFKTFLYKDKSKYKNGITLEELYYTDQKYAKWILQKYNPKNEEISQGVKTYLNYAFSDDPDYL